MNLLVFGSTGPSGREVVKLALEQGHRVTAFARNPADFDLKHQNLTVAKGDITDRASISAAMENQQVVISTLGVRKLSRNSILSDGTNHILDAMQKNNVRRFICETSLSVGDSRGQMSWFFEYVILTTLLRNVFADKEVQERYITASSTDWTIVRPAMLTNGPRTGTYQAWVGKPPSRVKRRISRADVADFILKQLDSATYFRKCVGLSY